MTVSWYIFFPVNSQNNSYIFSKHTFYSVSAFKFWKDLLKPIYIKKKKKSFVLMLNSNRGFLLLSHTVRSIEIS